VRLRVLSYNVHGLRGDQGALRSLVRAAEPDVVVAQEAPRRLRWRTRCATLARDLDLLYAAGGGTAMGNLILTSHRVRVHETWCLRFPLTPGRHLRGAAFASASVGPVRFVVAGSHLSTDAAERQAQADRLAKAIAEASPGVPVILGVDLNEPPGGPAWQALGAGLVDGSPDGLAPTFPAANPSRRIDAVLADPAVRVAGYRVLATPAARRASDHLPILVDLDVPAGSGAALSGVDKRPAQPRR
jgi:endonuclease/exonuclease/phosphatase family metal-dependent hydrolase